MTVLLYLFRRRLVICLSRFSSLFFFKKMNEIPLSQGFNTIIGPAVLEIDQAIGQVQKSQDDLGKEIERLVAGKKKNIAFSFFFYVISTCL